MPKANITACLRGFLVGPIWWPTGAECFKPLDYNCTAEQRRTVGKMTLRDHVLRATNDGDFQSCTIALGEIIITRRSRGRTVTRTFPLNRFPSVADCLHPDGDDWHPAYDLDDSEAA